MRIKSVPGDFVVTERANLARAASGAWAVYRVRKVGVTTLHVQTRLAAILGVPRAQVVFPALKDKVSISTQFATILSGRAEVIEEKGFRAERIGYRQRPLSPADLSGNTFSIIIRDTDQGEAERLSLRLQRMGTLGVPNYFDEQRLGSFSPGWGYIGKAILRRDARSALHAYITRPFLGDPGRVRAFKRAANAIWPEWKALIEVAPRPSNFRSVLTYLIDHPEDYRKALNLIPRRLLAIYLAAYQSYLWNLTSAAYLERAYKRERVHVAHLRIAGELLPIHSRISPGLLATLIETEIALPHHRATFSPAVEQIAHNILAEEGFQLADLKARILRRGYLSRGDRSVLLVPQEVKVDPPAKDDLFPGRLSLRMRFVLRRGSYATLVLKAASAGSAAEKKDLVPGGIGGSTEAD